VKCKRQSLLNEKGLCRTVRPIIIYTIIYKSRVEYFTCKNTVKSLAGIIYPVVTHWQWGGGFLVKGIDYGGDIGRLGYTVNQDS
jgi:hypothetical protein